MRPHVETLILVLALVFGQIPTFTHNRFTENGKTFSQDGSAMVANCLTKVEESQMERLLCSGYILGIADLLSDGEVCITAEVEGKRLVEVFLRYSAKHEASYTAQLRDWWKAH